MLQPALVGAELANSPPGVGGLLDLATLRLCKGTEPVATGGSAAGAWLPSAGMVVAAYARWEQELSKGAQLQLQRGVSGLYSCSRALEAGCAEGEGRPTGHVSRFT